METLHTIAPARTKSVLTLVGIVAAIICSLVFFKETDTTARVEASRTEYNGLTALGKFSKSLPSSEIFSSALTAIDFLY
jgi:hypothetical protein